MFILNRIDEVTHSHSDQFIGHTLVVMAAHQHGVLDRMSQHDGLTHHRLAQHWLIHHMLVHNMLVHHRLVHHRMVHHRLVHHRLVHKRLVHHRLLVHDWLLTRLHHCILRLL